MKIKNNSIIDTVIDYANVKFGMEVKQEDVSKQLKMLSYRDTLKLVDAISNENDEAFSDIIDLSAVSEAYGTGQTATPSRATNRMNAQVAANSARRADNISMKQNRGPGATRTTAGSNKIPTGQGSNANAVGQDPDDVQRGQNADTANQASQQANQNAQEIERLKQLAMGNK